MAKTDEDLLLDIPLHCKPLFVPMLSREDATDRIFALNQRVSAILPTPYMTFEALAAMLNRGLTDEKDKISRATMYRFLRGVKHPLMRLETLVRLASSMGYDIEYKLVPRPGYEEFIEKRRKNPAYKSIIYSP